MSLVYPTFEEIAAQIRAEFYVQLPTIDPTVFGTWALSFANGNAVLAQSIMFLVRDLEKQLFPQTATGEFLDWWGGYEGLTRTPATGASGYAVQNLPLTGLLPAEYIGGNGVKYQQSGLEVTAFGFFAVTIVRVGTIATVTWLPPTNNYFVLATGLNVVMSGATQPEYNGTFTITVTSSTTFTYEVPNTAVTPATGAPQFTVNHGSILVAATTTGTETNLVNGSEIVSATDGTFIVNFDGLTGGAATETDEAYRARIMLSRSSISGVFTPDQVKLAALSISGNTRAFVKKPTVGGAGGAVDPYPGQTSVFILRDNDANIAPSATVIANTKTAIIDEGKLPANSAEGDLYVQAPTLVEAAFTFTALSPDTTTMRTAIEDNLTALFADSAEFEEDVTEASFWGTIQNTQDLTTGAFVSSFTIIAPAADVAVAAGEIATIGVFTWF